MKYTPDNYPYKMQPFAHQRQKLEESWSLVNYASFWDMGLGKSKFILDTAGLQFLNGAINGLVLMAPKGVYRNWTNKEIPEHMSDAVQMRIFTWRNPLRKADEKELLELLEPRAGTLDVLVINIDAMNTKKGYAVLEAFLRSHSAMFVIDEATRIKNHQAQRTKMAIGLGKKAKSKRILTGSPVTKSPLDVFAPSKFLSSSLLGFGSYYAFRNRYALMEQTYGSGGKMFPKIVGFQNIEELQQKLQTFSSRLTKEECLDLPPRTYVKRYIELTDEQKKAYKEMKEKALVQMSEGECSVTFVITQIMKLHQISCGFLRLDDGTVVPIANRRIDALRELLDEAGEQKTIIWATHRPLIKMLEEELKAEYGEDSIVSYYGDTSDADRDAAIKTFQDPNSPVRFFIGNPQTAGYGITLTQATLVVHYSINYDLEQHSQANDRNYRIGQTRPVTYVYLIGEGIDGIVDERIVDSLVSKQELSDKTLGDKMKEWLK